MQDTNSLKRQLASVLQKLDEVKAENTALRHELKNRVSAPQLPLDADLLRASREVLQWIEAKHRPPVRDELECGRMANVRLHALADLHEAVKAADAKANDHQAILNDAEIGRVVWRFIDRMQDYCEVDTAERILDQFIEAVSIPLEKALDHTRSVANAERVAAGKSVLF